MNNVYVYDFDETIYDGDVTRDFYRYCLKKHPKVYRHLIYQFWAFIRYILGYDKWTKFKSNMLGYFKYLDDIDIVVSEFWKEHEYKIKKWYLKKDHSNDIIISASPEFLLNDICYNYLNVKLLIGTCADKKLGVIYGKNCFGNQKVIRLNEKINDYNILEFYSDSLSDNPLAKMAKKSYIVRGDNLIDWEVYKLPKIKEFKTLLLSRDFILFVLIGLINTCNGVVFSLLFRYLMLNSYIAFVCGYVSSNVVAYLLNSVIIFKEKLSVIKYVKFFISYMPNFFIQLIIVFMFSGVLGLIDWLAYLIAAIIGVPITFLFLKQFAFKPKNKYEINPYLYKEM